MKSMVRVLVGMCMALLMMVQSCLAADVAALVKVKDGKNWGVVDQQGRVILPFEFSEIVITGKGIMRVKGENKKFAIYDAGSRVILPMEFDTIWQNDDGSYFASKEKKFGYYDANGILIGQNKFDDVKLFNEGLAAVKIGKQWGFVDVTGKLVIPVQFDDVSSFAEGLAAARMLMYGKEASNRKQEIDRQHYTIPNQRPKDKHCGKI